MVRYKNSGHCLECHTGSHSENGDKATPSKRVRKSNMLLNLNNFNRFVRKHRKRSSYNHAMGGLLESRDSNPTHSEFFNNSLISELKNKNNCFVNHMDKASVDGRGSIARTLYREDNMDGWRK